MRVLQYRPCTRKVVMRFTIVFLIATLPQTSSKSDIRKLYLETVVIAFLLQCNLFLRANPAISCLLSLQRCCRKLMMAPNLLRVGTPEKIFVECQDCTDRDIRVEIKVMNHPTKTETLKSTAVSLNSGNHFQALGELTVKVTQTLGCARLLPWHCFLCSSSFLCVLRFPQPASAETQVSSSTFTCRLTFRTVC